MKTLSAPNTKHFISLDPFSKEELLYLIQKGLAFKQANEWPQAYQHVFVANLFFENSTRTHKSFEIAERKMGMNVIPFEASTSSVQKGETLYDTVLTLSAIGADICVIRHYEEAFYKELLDSPSIQTHIINAGDGSGEHPSQSLLDIMTIYEEFGSFEGLHIAIVGDLRHSRVAKSNMKILHRLGARLYFSGPKEWFDDRFNDYGQYVDMDELVTFVDVMMMLRVQHERHENQEQFSKTQYHQQYGLTLIREQQMKDQAIILHPAPVNRDVELASDLVEAPRSRIVTQMSNGVFARMAILDTVMHYKEEE